MIKILVLNVGSSSIKYKLFSGENVLVSGKIERISDKKGYEQGMKKILNVVGSEVDAVGHRVVHGGELRSASLIDSKVVKEIEKYSKFAPLHNPPELHVIRLCQKLFKVPQIAVFDTAFHMTVPEKAHVYGLPYSYYKKGVRRYGFHGTSHKYVFNEAKKILKSSGRVITCHIGNGASVTAIKNGKSVETSMGFTPLEGLVMGTRCGDIDPAIVLYLIKEEKMSVNAVDNLLNKKSGLLGLSGVGSDIRDVVGNKGVRCRLTLDVFCHRIAKYIGAYTAVLGGVDAIVFTGGIGENEAHVRKKVLDHFGYLGLNIDSSKNRKHSKVISGSRSKVNVLVIPTNEELMIAREVKSCI